MSSQNSEEKLVELVDRLIRLAKQVGEYRAQNGFDSCFLYHHAKKDLEEKRKELLKLVVLAPTISVEDL